VIGAFVRSASSSTHRTRRLLLVYSLHQRDGDQTFSYSPGDTDAPDPDFSSAVFPILLRATHRVPCSLSQRPVRVARGQVANKTDLPRVVNTGRLGEESAVVSRLSLTVAQWIGLRNCDFCDRGKVDRERVSSWSPFEHSQRSKVRTVPRDSNQHGKARPAIVERDITH
jgi:hypothetical protein